MNISDINYLFFSSFLTNLKNFLASLTMIDVIFFFAVLLLMILLVTLFYFIKSNEDYYDVHEENNNDFNQVENFVEESQSSPSIDYSEENAVININEIDNNLFNSTYNDEEGGLLDLETISKKLENKENTPIDLTMFEEEQERDAIISYDELLKKSSIPTVTYKRETMLDDLSVKEVDLDSLSKPLVKNESESVNQTISYGEEEAFLDALKRLQQQLN